MIAFGGTDMAIKRWQKKADRYDLDSSPFYRRRLRLRSVIASLQARGLVPQLGALQAFGSMPLARVQAPSRPVSIVEGVNPAVVDMQSVGGRHWRPRYDLSDLRWQLEDCPAVTSWTCTSECGHAAALFWHGPSRRDLWKIAPIGTPDEVEAMAACVAGALRHISRAGGSEALVITSRLDKATHAALSRNGLKPGKATHPIFFMDTEPDSAPDCVEGTSCLDADEGHRF